MKNFSLDLTGVKGALAAILIVISLIASVLGAVQNALPPKIETLGTSNFDSITLSGGLNAANVTASTITATTLVSQTVNLSSANITATTAISAAALKIASNTLSGFAIISAAVTNGALVAHNLGAIPKVICQPIAGGTNTSITDTVWISATNTTSFTVGIIESLKNGVSADTVNINCLAFR